MTRLALGSDYGMHDARWVSRFHSDERQAPAYRVGRVFLAGDAAHVHSPAGGQGMNTGLQDAANLSWKLAAVLRGRAPDSLLDSYQTERHPVGKQVLRSSGALIRLALLPGAPGARRPRPRRPARQPSAAAVRAAAVRTISGIGIAYAGRARRPPPRRPPRPRHPPGRRQPPLRTPPPGPVRPHHPRRRARRPPRPRRAGCSPRPAEDRVLTASWQSGRRTALLVRPDGYIAWATDATAPAERARGATGRPRSLDRRRDRGRRHP